jgi:hypothetical protein
MNAPGDRPANRLARETSPYLLQHAHNPVDWYAWGEEAFARARDEDRCIFLSIGYSTCHWCHVMERESFENIEVAMLLNTHFVCVKVDREERPDVDRLYMAAAQAMGVGGGWPLNVFLSPELTPFFGGTYFPPTARQGRPGLMELLPRVQAAWSEQRADILAGGERVLEAVRAIASVAGEPAPIEALAAGCARMLSRAHDAVEGGFGNAPKFPSPANLAFLLRWWAREPATRAEARTMALHQLDAMRAGGIHDHVGGGFHRYATDREWLTPHFEKMLYDQALLADAYLDGLQAGGDPAYADVARGIFAYVARDLSAPEGGFYSAEDADSEGEEGLFYVWTPAQLAEALGADEARLVGRHFGVTPQGNFEHGASILHEPHALVDTARTFAMTPGEALTRLAKACATLLEARARRIRPHRDEKILASWNGLMIAAFAHGARVLGDAALAERAARAAEFAWTRLLDHASGALHRHFSAGAAAGEGQLDDHACMARALLELYATTFEPRWLERAARLTEVQITRFWDDADGAFFESPAGDASVRVRMKDGFDGAELAGNSVAAGNLARLAALQPDGPWRVKLDRLLDYHARRLSESPWAMPQMLIAMDLAAHPARHVVIAGEPSRERDALLAAARRGFRPFDQVVVVDEAARAALSARAPFAASLQAVGAAATAYVCVDHACRLPVTDPAALAAQLDETAPPGATTESA